MLPNDVRYANENRHIQELQQWRLGPLPYTMQPPEIVNVLGMESQSWSPVDSGAEGARPKTEEQKTDTSGSLLQEDSSFERDICIITVQNSVTANAVYCHRREV